MSSRVIIRNHVVWQRYSADELPPRRRGKRYSPLPRDKDGLPVNVAEAIAPVSPLSPYREGMAYTDPDDGITYRCVAHLDPLDGWAVTELWQERWKLDHRDLVLLVEYGLLDASIEVGSVVKRYRCRDERLLKEHAVFKAQVKKAAIRRRNTKRPRSAFNPKGWAKSGELRRWQGK